MTSRSESKWPISSWRSLSLSSLCWIEGFIGEGAVETRDTRRETRDAKGTTSVPRDDSESQTLRIRDLRYAGQSFSVASRVSCLTDRDVGNADLVGNTDRPASRPLRHHPSLILHLKQLARGFDQIRFAVFGG